MKDLTSGRIITSGEANTICVGDSFNTPKVTKDSLNRKHNFQDKIYCQATFQVKA